MSELIRFVAVVPDPFTGAPTLYSDQNGNRLEVAADSRQQAIWIARRLPNPPSPAVDLMSWQQFEVARAKYLRTTRRRTYQREPA